MNAKQLNAFRAVMLSGSMVGAAKMLYVSQPAITRLIKDLEVSCGFDLFERRNSRLFATPEGNALYQEVKRHFIGLDNLAQMAGQIRMTNIHSAVDHGHLHPLSARYPVQHLQVMCEFAVLYVE